MAPFFSVIIPTYNRPAELKRAVHSVLSQTCSDFEIVIVNNGKRVEIDLNDKRIKLLSENRKGANFARNTGIENAHGQFICFLDDDDIYLENHLKTLFNLIQANGCRVGLYRTFTRIETSRGKFSDQPVVMKGENQTPLDHLFTILLFMACVCCHKEIVKKIKYDPSIPVAQDYHFFARVLALYPIFETPVITTVYNKTENSISSPKLITYMNYIKVHEDLFNTIEIRSRVKKKTRHKRMLRYFDLLITCHYRDLSVRQFFWFSLRTFRYNYFYLPSFHYFKIFGKFWLSKFFKF